MREKPVPAKRQYELIMECRSSGLSDAQWCLEHGIKPGTFYNWVSKLKKKACYDIPEPGCTLLSVPSSKQDVVRINVKEDEHSEEDLSYTKDSGYVMEIAYRMKTIRVTNDISPELLKIILGQEAGCLC